MADQIDEECSFCKKRLADLQPLNCKHMSCNFCLGQLQECTDGMKCSPSCESIRTIRDDDRTNVIDGKDTVDIVNEENGKGTAKNRDEEIYNDNPIVDFPVVNVEGDPDDVNAIEGGQGYGFVFKSAVFCIVIAILCPLMIALMKVNGGYNDWSAFSTCTQSCGGGTQERKRICNNPSPKYGGVDCSNIGVASETRVCGANPCPVNGGYNDWSSFSTCTQTCGGGIQERKRYCNNPSTKYGGVDCFNQGVTTESRECGTNPCSVDGAYNDWSAFSSCTKSCGGGKQERKRFCSSPSPKYGGVDCSNKGVASETRECGTDPCPVNGGYNDWSAFSTCTKTCGGGSQKRKRICNNPSPKYGGVDCSNIGVASKTRKCGTNPCAVNGGYNDWSAFSTCTATCGGGIQERKRICNKPSPKYGGVDCSKLGVDTKSRECGTNLCPVRLYLQSPLQSSTYAENVAFRALDGKLDGLGKTGGCAETNDIHNKQWWKAQLATDVPIVVNIKIMPRTDCCKDRYSKVKVYTSRTSLDDGWTLCTDLANKLQTSDTWVEARCYNSRPARYIKVVLEDKRRFALCEIEVWGYVSPSTDTVDFNLYDESTIQANRLYPEYNAKFIGYGYGINSMGKVAWPGKKFKYFTAVVDCIVYCTQAKTEDESINGAQFSFSKICYCESNFLVHKADAKYLHYKL